MDAAGFFMRPLAFLSPLPYLSPTPSPPSPTWTGEGGEKSLSKPAAATGEGGEKSLGTPAAPAQTPSQSSNSTGR